MPPLRFIYRRENSMKLKIVPTKEGFEVRDEKDALYGPSVKTRQEAEQVLEDWEAYYRG